jgi:hypothetical protein
LIIKSPFIPLFQRGIFQNPSLKKRGREDFLMDAQKSSLYFAEKLQGKNLYPLNRGGKLQGSPLRKLMQKFKTQHSRSRPHPCLPIFISFP